jgi:holdfast attachment protein HfaA
MNRFTIAALGSVLLFAGTAYGDDYSNAASYNHGYGMDAGSENQAINPSLRDANGNLTNVNGQFTSSSMSQSSGVHMSQSGASMSALGGGNSGAAFGGATAIGNQLNVITTGNFNTVIVSSHQTNSGTQTATVSLNGQK